MKRASALVLVLGAFGDAGCGGGSGSSELQKVQLSGSVQKGPFVLGSTVNISPLDSQGNPTGKLYSTKTTNDLGEFSLEFDAAGLVSLEGSGFYYNEATGALSAAPLTLHAFYDVQSSGAQSAYINMVTHLTYDRVKRLMGNGMSLSAATTQAEAELKQEMALGSALDPSARGIGMNILGGDSDPNAYLFVLSAVVTAAGKAKAGEGGSVDANTQELINTTSVDLADDGKLSPGLAQRFIDAQHGLDPDEVMAKLRIRLADLGSGAAVPDMNRFLDTDGDGVVNTSDNCPLTANTSQAPVTNAICRMNPSVTVLPDHYIALHAVGDFLQDGKSSALLLAAPQSNQNVAVAYVMPGQAGGGLGAPRAATFVGVAPTMNYQGVEFMDVTGDGLADLYLGYAPGLGQSGAGVVYPSTGAGGFAAALHTGMVGTLPGFLLGGPPVIAANINNASLYEMIGVTSSAGGLLQQTYTGTAGKEWNDAVLLDSLASFQYAGMRLASGDLNGDGKADLVAAGTTSSGAKLQFVVGLGDGTGGFAFHAPADVAAASSGSLISCINLVDLDGDGKLDLAFRNVLGQSDVMAWSKGDGVGGFGAVATANMSSSQRPRDVCNGRTSFRFVADVTGDGKPDFVWVTRRADNVPVLRVVPNTGAGFGALQELRLPYALRDGVIGDDISLHDMNQDGTADLVMEKAGLNGSGLAVVLLNSASTKSVQRR